MNSHVSRKEIVDEVTIEELSEIQLPDEVFQKIVNSLAEVFDVPSALIMRVDFPEIEVLTSSETEGNPYKVGDKEHLDGLYCETVMESQEKLLIPNALKDPEWDDNPDIKLGMISYLGFPINWPTGDRFGTICVLDSEENGYNKNYELILSHFRNLVEENLRVLYQNHVIRKKQKTINRLKQLLRMCSYCTKIKYDGTWVTPEVYIKKERVGGITHGICKSCTEKYFG